MKKRKIYFALFITVAILTLTYLGGCDKSFTSEPEKPLIQKNDNSAIDKITDKEKERRKLLLEKFQREVAEAIQKVKDKWAKRNENGSFGTTQLAPVEQEAMDLANAITPSAYSYVSSAYGVDLYQYYSPGDPNIALTGTVISCLEADAQAGIYYEIDGEVLYSMNSNLIHNSNFNPLKKTKDIQAKLADCIFQALGIPVCVVTGLAGKGGTITINAVVKVVGRLARNALGWIGAAVALFQFSSCMDWV